MSPYSGAFEQLFCPGGGAFASSFSKNANSWGSARGGGGGMGTTGIDDALQRLHDNEYFACMNALKLYFDC